MVCFPLFSQTSISAGFLSTSESIHSLPSPAVPLRFVPKMTKSAKEVFREEEDEEKKAMEEKMREEEELKKEKERQAFLDNIYVMVAVVIIVAGAVGIVFAKIHFFSEEVEKGSQALHQKVIKLFIKICFWFLPM